MPWHERMEVVLSGLWSPVAPCWGETLKEQRGLPLLQGDLKVEYRVSMNDSPTGADAKGLNENIFVTTSFYSFSFLRFFNCLHTLGNGLTDEIIYLGKYKTFRDVNIFIFLSKLVFSLLMNLRGAVSETLAENVKGKIYRTDMAI